MRRRRRRARLRNPSSIARRRPAPETPLWVNIAGGTAVAIGALFAIGYAVRIANCGWPWERQHCQSLTFIT
jgi:hypothetical protein